MHAVHAVHAVDAACRMRQGHHATRATSMACFMNLQGHVPPARVMEVMPASVTRQGHNGGADGHLHIFVSGHCMAEATK